MASLELLANFAKTGYRASVAIILTSYQKIKRFCIHKRTLFEGCLFPCWSAGITPENVKLTRNSTRI